MSSATGSNAPGEDDSQLLAVLNYYQANQLRVYIASAGFALLFFEYLITFHRELSYIRDHKRTWAKAMFILNRYLSLLQAAATLFSAMLPMTTFVRMSSSFTHIVYANIIVQSCVFLGRMIEVLQISLFAVWAVFSALRVYALSNNDRVIVALVGLLSLTPVITYCYIASVSYYEIDAVPYAPYPEICEMGYNVTMEVFQEFGVLTHVPLILSEALVIVVTFMRIWNVALRRNDSPMVQVPRLVLKEGVLYFLAMLLVNSTQIISDFLYNTQFAAACIIFNLLVPILVSRFYLNLHDVRKAEDERKAEEKASEWERIRTCRKSKPLPPIPEYDDTKICYLDEVFQYNSRLLGRSATFA